MKIGSLCSGYGGLDMAVEAYFDAETIWMADTDKSASIAIEKNWSVRNLGDLKTLKNHNFEDVDILTAGYPCQPFSNAGYRKGTKDERHLWPYIAEIISKIRPSIIVLENVRGHLSLGFKEVLADITKLGYDARWGIVRASDVGAPHQRARLFVIAYANGDAYTKSRRILRRFREETEEEFNRSDRQKYRSGFEIINTYGIDGRISLPHEKIITDSDGQRPNSRLDGRFETEESTIKGITPSDTNDKQLSPDRQMSKLGRRFNTRSEMSMRPIPNPLVDGKLNTKYVEYMMGLPEGWVTNLPVSRAQQFKLLGNGVVPQQAYYALEMLGA